MDKYDEAIEYLTEHPEEIFDAWSFPNHVAHCLFQKCVRKGFVLTRELAAREKYGCLTQIRDIGGFYGKYVGATEKLTAEILADERIPSNERNIKISDLEIFAEWQRRIDSELVASGVLDSPSSSDKTETTIPRKTIYS